MLTDFALPHGFPSKANSQRFWETSSRNAFKMPRDWKRRRRADITVSGKE